MNNLEWDADFSAGDVFDFEFQVAFAMGSPRPMVVDVVIDGQNICNADGSTNPTGPPDVTTDGPDPTTGGPVVTTEAPPPSGGDYDYNDVLAKSILFYEAQRSGPLPADNRIDWRGDSAMDDYVLGGYYDGMIS